MSSPGGPLGDRTRAAGAERDEPGEIVELTCAEVVKLKISRRPIGQGEVIALPLAAGAERPEAADGDASRYRSRYSSDKDQGSHAKICQTRGCNAQTRRYGQTAVTAKPRLTSAVLTEPHCADV